MGVRAERLFVLKQVLMRVARELKRCMSFYDFDDRMKIDRGYTHGVGKERWFAYSAHLKIGRRHA